MCSRPDPDPSVERFQDANFGTVPLESVRGVDVAKVLSEWLVSALKEIDESGESVDGHHPAYHLNFPPALSAAQRKIVHHNAYTLKLRSTSHGDRDGRFLRVTLVNRGSLSEKVLQFADSDQLEQAINHRDTKKNSKVPKGMSLILDHLYLGSGKDAQDKEALKAAGVTVVLNVTAEWRTSHPNDFTHHRIELNDTVRQSLNEGMEQACEIIKAAKEANPPGKVLVHCVMGRSRSASIVMAYLVLHENMTLKEAFELTHQARPIVRPNSRFLSDLIAWEVRHKGSPTLEVESWVGLVGIHGSQRHNENWKQKKLPPPIDLSKDEAGRLTHEALSAFLTEELYLSIVTESCENSYTSRFIPKFMNGVKAALEAKTDLLSALHRNGVAQADAVKTAQLISKPWYMERIPKDEPKKPRAKQSGLDASSSSSSAASLTSSSSSNDV